MRAMGRSGRAACRKLRAPAPKSREQGSPRPAAAVVNPLPALVGPPAVSFSGSLNSERFSFEPRTWLSVEGTVKGERNEIGCAPELVNAMSDLNAHRLELRADLSELRRLAEWIKARAPQVLSADGLFAVQLCLEEAVANIIMHGGGKGDRLEIAIELERNGGTLVARIEDTGCEFDPTQFPSRSVTQSLEKAKVGDCGIHLMRCFARGMHYERQQGRNRLTLRFAEPH
jgi:serine/threonine-protein kinase RsbW